jgi:mono/diheme cytochrome c family protein
LRDVLREGMSKAACFAAVLLAAMVSLGCKKDNHDQRAQGKALFGSMCARCHGDDGAGGMPAYDGGPAPRNFTDHEFHTKRVDAELRQTIINGKGLGMPAFGTTFTSEQLDALVAHVRSFDRGDNK